MAQRPQCEVCKRTHRVLAWRLAAGGSMWLCVVCRFALEALDHWREARPNTSLEALIAELPAHLPASAADRLAGQKKTA